MGAAVSKRRPTLSDLFCAEQELVRAVAAHNVGVTLRRRRGEDATAPHNQYRNAVSEIRAMHPELEGAAR